MCEIYDSLWQPVLVFLVLFSVATILVRLKYSLSAVGQQKEPPPWLPLLVFWGSGFVALTMLVFMVLGFACAGSPGDYPGIVPN